MGCRPKRSRCSRASRPTTIRRSCARKLRVAARRRRSGGRGRHGRRAGDRPAGGRPGAGTRADARRRRPARDARAQDRRAHPRVGGQRRDHGGRRRRARRRRSTDTPPSSAWRFRSSTTSSTSKATPATLGKTAGKDAAGAKPTYPALFGLERSRALAAECVERAHASLDEAGLTDGWLGADRRLGCVTQKLSRLREHSTADTEDEQRTRHRAGTECRDCCDLRCPDRVAKRKARLDVARRRARPGAVARARARADPRRPGDGRRPGGLEGGRAGRGRRPRRARHARSSVRRARRRQARARARRVRDRPSPDAARSTSAPRPAASPTCCCSAARRASSRSTSATASSIGGCAPTRASSCAKASTRAR